MSILLKDFYERGTLSVARDLLGHCLIHEIDGKMRIGRIVEVEAYLGGDDKASHASKGITKRNAVMFGPAGFSYVYLIYGMYHCFNIVTERDGQAGAVLIRALEPIQNITQKTSGPGLLCQAMGIDRSLNKHCLLRRPLYLIHQGLMMGESVVECSRIGVPYAEEWQMKPFRFYIDKNPWVSKKASMVAMGGLEPPTSAL